MINRAAGAAERRGGGADDSGRCLRRSDMVHCLPCGRGQVTDTDAGRHRACVTPLTPADLSTPPADLSSSPLISATMACGQAARGRARWRRCGRCWRRRSARGWGGGGTSTGGSARAPTAPPPSRPFHLVVALLAGSRSLPLFVVSSLCLLRLRSEACPQSPACFDVV